MDGVYKQVEYKLNLLSEYGTDKKEVDEIMKDFQMLYTDVMINIKNKNELLERMANENILDRMDKILETVENEDVLVQYKSIDIPMTVKYVQSDVCDHCAEPMIQSNDRTSYECLDCNLTKAMFNTLIDTSRNIPRSKIGNFNPERHFKTWIDRILAKESEDELRVAGIPNGEVVIEKIKDSLISRSKSIEHITIDDIRLILKELKITSLNKNTSLIAKKITGRSPPNLTDDQYMRVHSLFVLVMEARDKIDNINKCNRIYYPYYIAKILDLILVDQEQRKILHYIHLHKETTLSSNDVEWSEICNIVPQLEGKYRPTVPSTCRYI
jgi:hypothetical protein